MQLFGVRLSAGTAMAFALLTTVALPVEAQECDLRAIVPDGTNQVPNIQTNFTCVSSKLSAALSRIEALEADLKPFREAKGIVAAFDRSHTERPCPTGWSLFAPAGGRFIVGAGLNGNKDKNNQELSDYPTFKDEPANAVGGEEKHAQKLEELVPHKHGGTTQFANEMENVIVVYQAGPSVLPNHVVGIQGGKLYRREDRAAMPGAVHTHNFETDNGTGALGNPQNTMPPFVALYYCIKD